MKGYQPVMSFGEDVAALYRDVQRGDEVAPLHFWRNWTGRPGAGARHRHRADRAASGRAGIRVDGIELSPAMIAQLRAKPGGDQIAVTIGDFADVPVSGAYGLIYVVFNTLFNLLTQEDQVRCFENVAAHLTDDGSFVVEAYVPAFFTGCATINMWMRRPSKSMKSGSICSATTPRRR